MTATQRLIVRISLFAVLCLAVGFDIANRPKGREWSGFSLVNAVPAANLPGRSIVGLVGSDNEDLSAPVSRDSKLSEAQVEEMVRHAITMAGGLHQRLKVDAESVAIKVNIVELRENGSGGRTHRLAGGQRADQGRPRDRSGRPHHHRRRSG